MKGDLNDGRDVILCSDAVSAGASHMMIEVGMDGATQGYFQSHYIHPPLPLPHPPCTTKYHHQLLTIVHLRKFPTTPVIRLPPPNHTISVHDPAMLILARPRIAVVRDRVEIDLTPIIRARGHRIAYLGRRDVRALGPGIPLHFELVQHESRGVETHGVEGRFPFDESEGVAGAVVGWGAEIADVGEDLVRLRARDRGVGCAGVGGEFGAAG